MPKKYNIWHFFTVKRSIVSCLIFLLTLSCSVACGHRGLSDEQLQKPELTVSVAASVQNAMNDVKSIYELTNDVTIYLNTGSSGMLKRQIEQGAPIDLFVSASERFMAQLVEQGKVDEATVEPLLTNDLVLITHAGYEARIDGFHDLTEDHVKRIAIGIPEAVPAGHYTQAVFANLGIWEQLYDKFIFTKDVRQVLSYVETGNVDVGVVYKSDAKLSSKVKLITEARTEWHGPIVYPAGIVTSTDQFRETEAFLRFLQTSEAETIFQNYGFQLWE